MRFIIKTRMVIFEQVKPTSKTLLRLSLIILVLSGCARHIKRKKYTIAWAPSSYSRVTNDVYAKYEVNGKVYKANFISWRTLHKGDCFRIVYDSLHPKKSHLLLEEPVFQPYYVTKKTIGVITDEYKGGDYFKYSAGKDSLYTYTKTQWHSRNIGDPHHLLQKGSHFIVEYNIMAPKVAIIRYNQHVPVPHSKRTVSVYHAKKHHDYRFVVNTILFRAIGPAYGFELKGERFTVAYDSLNPTDAQALVEEPTFFPYDSTIVTTGTITGMQKWTCEFAYHENTPGHNKKHTKTQQFYWYAPEKYNIQKNAKYEVRYLAKNPRIAVIYFDKPAERPTSRM